MSFQDIINWLSQAFGNIGNIVQNIFPQIQGIGTAINAAVYGINAATNNGINNLQNQLYYMGNNIVNNVNADINRATQVLGTIVQQGAQNVSNVVNAFQGNFFTGLQSVISYINQGENTIANIINNVNNNVTSQNGNISAILANLSAQNNPVRLNQEANFWDALSTLPYILENLLSIMPQKFAEELMKQLNIFNDGVGLSVRKQVDLLKFTVDNLTRGKYSNFDEAVADMQSKGIPAGIMMFVINIATLGFMLVKLSTSKTAPIFTALDALAWSDNPTRLLDASVLIELTQRGIFDSSKFNAAMAKLGFNPEVSRYMLQIADKYPDINSLTQYLWRGKISEVSYKKLVSEMGLIPGSEDIYQELAHSIPGPSDLTRIADKRVWGLHTDPKYGQYAELPDEYLNQMRKWGYDDQYVKWLWASHWQLPSPNEVFEMAHRGLIDRNDIATYLGLTDWLPFFRDKLFDITFNVFTRVDVRRLYKQGLLTDNELHEQHKKMGYTDADAYKLDAYVKQTNLPEDETETQALYTRAKKAVEAGYTSGKISPTEAITMLTELGETSAHANQIISLLEFENEIKNIQPVQLDLRANVRSMVVAAYKKGNISDKDARDGLLASGMTEQDIEYQLLLIQLERTITLKAMAQDTAQKLYAQYTINETEFYSRLGSLGFTANEMALAYAEALLMRDNRTKKLTVAQVTKLFKNGVITIEQYADELKGIGYTDKDVMYIIENDIAELGG